MRPLSFAGFLAVVLLAAGPAHGQNPGPGGVQPEVYLDITPRPKDPCEDAYKNRSSVIIHGARPPSVSNAPNAHIPADGTLGCDLPPYAVPPILSPELPPK